MFDVKSQQGSQTNSDFFLSLKRKERINFRLYITVSKLISSKFLVFSYNQHCLLRLLTEWFPRSFPVR